MVDNASQDNLLGGPCLKSIIGDYMKTEVKAEELKKLMPSTRAMIYYQVVGVQILMVALLFSNENIIYSLLLMMGAVALTEAFEKSRLQNKLKEIMD